MAFANFDTKEIHSKVLCFGPENSGKTETLRSFCRQTSPELKSGVLELGDPLKGGTPFDFLPLSIGYLKDFHLKMHFIVPPISSAYETVDYVVCKGVDAILYTADSRMEAMDSNIVCLRKTKENMAKHDIHLQSTPTLFQFNHRDSAKCIEIDTLNKQLNPEGAPHIETIALKNEGTINIIDKLVEIVVAKIVN